MHKLTAEETRSIIGDASSGDVLKAKLVTAGADPEWFVVRRTPPKLIECATQQEAREYEANWPGDVVSGEQLLHRLNATHPDAVATDETLPETAPAPVETVAAVVAPAVQVGIDPQHMG
jgi:hypothetical protein